MSHFCNLERDGLFGAPNGVLRDTGTNGVPIKYMDLSGKYRVIHKSVRDFRPLRYSSRDGHAGGEHVNIGRDTPSFCTTLQVLDMCTLVDF